MRKTALTLRGAKGSAKDINTLLSWKMTPQQILDFSYAYSRREYLCW